MCSTWPGAAAQGGRDLKVACLSEASLRPSFSRCPYAYGTRREIYTGSQGRLMQSSIISCSCDNIAGGVGVYFGGGLLSTLLALDSVRMRSNPQAPSTRTTVTHAPSTCDLLPPWQTVQDCTARAAGGVNIEGPAELVDCRILRCHAREFGGGLYVGGSNAFAKMTGGTISECSATYG